MGEGARGEGLNPTNSVIEKIKKLHALAERAGTEAEAALAADKVAELCRKHNLDIGVAKLREEEVDATESRYSHSSRNFQAHWGYLGKACEAQFGVGSYLDRKIGMFFVFYGLKANAQAAAVTYEYFLESVEAMLKGWNRGEGKIMAEAIPLGGRVLNRSFRMGCAKRIMDEAMKLDQAKRKALESGDAECQALILLESQLVRKHEATLRLTTGKRLRGASSAAFDAGYVAGGRVDLHGARKGRMLR